MDDYQRFYNRSIAAHLSISLSILPFKKDDHKMFSPNSTRYLVTLKYNEQQIVINYYSENEPTTSEVFQYIFILGTCVYKINFFDFCVKFGYDSDSIKVRNKYKMCKKIAKKLQQLIGTSQYEELMQC